MSRDKVTSPKVTNQSVGERIGLDQSYISLIRRGLRVPSREVMKAFVDAYPEQDQAALMTAYTDADPMKFAIYFNHVVGFPELEPVESNSR